MYIHSETEYQHALRDADELQRRGMGNLNMRERERLIETIRAIESYQYMNDPVAMLAFGVEAS